MDDLDRVQWIEAGLGSVPPRGRVEPDAVTREVIALVDKRFARHPGRLDRFAWPVTRAQALQSLHAFIEQRVGNPGRGFAIGEGAPDQCAHA